MSINYFKQSNRANQLLHHHTRFAPPPFVCYYNIYEAGCAVPLEHCTCVYLMSLYFLCVTDLVLMF